MKKLLLCILFVLLALPALADDGSPMWKDFKARWMSVFPAGSVTVQDQGQIKICTLEEGVTATFFLDNDGVVERAVVSNMLPSSSRYFEGVAQTIKVLAGQDPQTAAVSAAFATTAPAVLWRTAGGFCFERTQDPGAGWFFYASRGEQCPTEVK